MARATREERGQAPSGKRLTEVGIYINLGKHAARAALSGFCTWLESKRVKPFLLREQAEKLGLPDGVGPEIFFSRPQLIVSLGGDGTFLEVARELTGTRPALLGVNFGRLGYLTAVESSELVSFFERLLSGDLPVEHRMRLACKAAQGDIAPYALNDIVIQDAEGVRAMTIRLRFAERIVGVFRADGVIIATPTGSTAYSLSVGGPVVHPGIEAMLVAFVSPHTLSARPLVLDASHEVSVEISDERIVRIVMDGQKTWQLSSTEPIRIGRAPSDAAVVIDPERSFLDRLREKLAWGGNHTR